MEQTAYIMESITGFLCLVLGARLYWRGRQPGRLPERFLGITLLIWAVGYALYDIPYALVEEDETNSPFYSYSSMILFSMGNVALAIFVKEVFRKRENWAGWLVVAIALCALLGAAGTAWVGDWEQVEPFENPGYWPQAMVTLVPSLWLGVDGLTDFFGARRRASLRTDDPLFRHHILLLGVVGALWSVLEIVIIAQDIIYIHLGDWSGALGIVNGLLEIVPAVMLWLAFCPPTPYRRWLEGTLPA
jgi:hypothetical protein